jgi:Na+/phosphate symporter
MFIALVPVLVMVVGALVYGLSANPKVQEMGRLAFGAGLLVACWAFAGHAVRLP